MGVRAAAAGPRPHFLRCPAARTPRRPQRQPVRCGSQGPARQGEPQRPTTEGLLHSEGRGAREVQLPLADETGLKRPGSAGQLHEGPLGPAAARAVAALRRQQWWQRGPLADLGPVQPELVAIALGEARGTRGHVPQWPQGLTVGRGCRSAPPACLPLPVRAPPACRLPQSTWCRACWGCRAWQCSPC